MTRIDKGKSGRQFKWNGDGTLSPAHASHLVLGLPSKDAEPTFPYNADGEFAVLGDKGSKSALVFEHAKALKQGEAKPLTLKSHPGRALVGREPTAESVAEWSVIQIGLGPAEVAINAQLQEKEFVSRTADGRVFDIHHWQMIVGNRLCLLKSAAAHPARTRLRHKAGPGGRSFVFNSDGTLSPLMAPNLVLCAQDAKAVDYTKGASVQA